MLWFAEVAGAIDPSTPQVINDSKTPSGRVHVGAHARRHHPRRRAPRAQGPRRAGAVRLRRRRLRPARRAARRPERVLRTLPRRPALQRAPPAGSPFPDMAEHFISEFFQVFKELGVHAETYRMRDFYRSGRLNESIDRILSNATAVRGIYKAVSNSTRSEKWYPFQVICEQCRRIGTTEVSAYDGKEVEYACRPNLVKWAKGCGHHGKMSPFDGRGKLPWKLEWVAKWRVLGVTIEGAGKDHTTKGGARDVSGACLEQIFGEKPPLNIPYEFFLVGGAKMSSSKGIGASARDMANFLPPEILRFLILRTQPKTPVNFALTEEFIVKLFNDFDRLHKRAFNDPAIREDEKELYRLCEIGEASEGDFFDSNLQLVLTFLQMPHVDLTAEMEKRKGGPLTAVEKQHLDARIRAARYWLDHFASEEDRIHLQERLPARAEQLSATQRAFLHHLANALRTEQGWEDDALQARIFDVARRTPITQGEAFKAIYRVFLDREMGPRAGALMAVLKRDFAIGRLSEPGYDKAAFWAETGTTLAAFDAWLDKEKAKVERITAEHTIVLGPDGQPARDILDFLVTQRESGKVETQRVVIDRASLAADARATLIDRIGELAARHGVKIEVGVAAHWQPEG